MKFFCESILGQLSELEEINYRAMMGEFILYYRGKIVGGIYDDQIPHIQKSLWIRHSGKKFRQLFDQISKHTHKAESAVAGLSKDTRFFTVLILGYIYSI